MSVEQWIISVMSGQTRGVGAGATRAALAFFEPAYASAAARRNRGYDDGRRPIRRLPRPVISVGNLTTGGTGKTPAVQWLVRQLEASGHHPGVLLRGYRKAATDASSDEESLLRESLGVPVVADPDRFRGGIALLAAPPDVSIIVLDDGFQHRSLARDVDIVLIDATNPFGFGHVLPRGLLREPMVGLSRADQIWITRANQADEKSLIEIESTIRQHNPSAPISRTIHRPAALLSEAGRQSLEELAGSRVFALSAIGNPAAFEASLAEAGMNVVGSRRFTDHHNFMSSDVRLVIDEAQSAGAMRVLTTEKDWVKLASLPEVKASPIAFVRLAIELAFVGDQSQHVMTAILAKCGEIQSQDAK